MIQETFVVRNLSILRSLSHGHSSLESIAENAGFRPLQVERSLRQLQKQGLVSMDKGSYSLLCDPLIVANAYSLVSPWLDQDAADFYGIACDVAGIILNRSYASVVDVGLFGSVLNSSSPRDIDLLVVHGSEDLSMFKNRYREEGKVDLHDVDPGVEHNSRLDAFWTLVQLGYQDDISRCVVRLVGERIEDLDLCSLSKQKYDGAVASDGKNVACYEDVFGVNNLFDIQVLHMGVISPQRAADAHRDYLLAEDCSHDYADEMASFKLAEFSALQKQAISSCKDPSFWFRILSEVKFFDKKEHDFVHNLEAKYPSCIDFFK